MFSLLPLCVPIQDAYIAHNRGLLGPNRNFHQSGSLSPPHNRPSVGQTSRGDKVSEGMWHFKWSRLLTKSTEKTEERSPLLSNMEDNDIQDFVHGPTDNHPLPTNTIQPEGHQVVDSPRQSRVPTAGTTLSSTQNLATPQQSHPTTHHIDTQTCPPDTSPSSLNIADAAITQVLASGISKPSLAITNPTKAQTAIGNLSGALPSSAAKLQTPGHGAQKHQSPKVSGIALDFAPELYVYAFVQHHT